MKVIKHTATINGVETTMLFTPRLFEFKTASMDFSDAGTSGKVAGMCADIAYCAALNFWTLSERDVEDFKLTRVDFHEWAMMEPADFGKTVRITLEALTNKSLDEILKNNQTDEKAPKEEVKKKTSLSITQKLKRFWSALVG